MSKTRIIDFFGDLTDFRSPYRNKQHELIDIVAISICAVICGADSWEEIEEYAKVKVEWLTTFLSLPNGIPSHDTINRVMSSICPIEFENCFKNWIKSLIIAISDSKLNKISRAVKFFLKTSKINGLGSKACISALGKIFRKV